MASADLRSGGAGEPCLDEDEILAFVGGELESQRRRAVLAHVGDCASCRELTALVVKVEGEPDADRETPERDDADESVVDGRYRTAEVLGRGATATVYRARDQKLDIDVALKVLRSGAGQKDFAREVLAGRRIAHANVCRLYDAGTADGVDYITMELVDGETLAHRLTRGELSTPDAVALLDGIAAGLEAVHEAGIVHRDLKPANVMIERRTGRPVLTDFGFAATLESKQSRRLVGTPAFWPPEQARGEPATPASDVYSFGVIAYRLLSRTELTLSDRDAFGRVPRAYRSALEGCLALAPSDRYRDARAARAALLRARRPDRRPLFALAALLALAVAGGAVAALRPAPARAVADGAAVSATSAQSSAASSSAPAPLASAVPAVPEPVVSGATRPPVAHPSFREVAVSPAQPTARVPSRPVASLPVASGTSPAASAKPAKVPAEGDLLYVK